MAFQNDSIYWVEIEKIVPNPFQPRKEFDENKLKELSESIRMYGILQPIIVTRREIERDDGAFSTEYELIAGERRLRASKIAGLSQMPVIIRSGEDTQQEKLELAIIENLQREDLSAVDRALAFKQLAEQFKLSHTQVAKKVGRSREYVSNSIRLLQLPETILSALRIGDLTEGHSRTLLMLNDRPEEQDVVFRETLLKKLSVREVEKIARKIATDKVRKKDWGMDPELLEIEKKFTDTLGTRVQISKTDFGGKLVIDYFSNDDLHKLLSLVNTQGGIQIENSHKIASEQTEKLAEHTALESVEDQTVVHDDIPKKEAEQTTDSLYRKSELHSQINTVSHTDEYIALEDPVDVGIEDSFSQEKKLEDLLTPKAQETENQHIPPNKENIRENNRYASYLDLKQEERHPFSRDNNETSPFPAKEEKKPDDSDLYSINNFTL